MSRGVDVAALTATLDGLPEYSNDFFAVRFDGQFD
jgi:hypothetical protein